MIEGLPTHRLEEFAALSKDEIARIKALGQPGERVPRQTAIRSEGEKPEFVYYLLDGWVSSSLLLPDGRRQLLKFHLPGDMLGTPSVCLQQAPDTLTTITSATISRIAIGDFMRLMSLSPRFAIAMFLSVQRERVALIDQLATIGRRNSRQRVLHLLLDLMARLSPLGLVRDNGFELPLTQEMIGDYLGFTAVHVNRTLRELEADGTIVREGRRLTILNPTEVATQDVAPPRQLVSAEPWMTIG